jgi:hypothetical protein
MTIDIAGQKFGRLTVLSRAEGRPSHFYEFVCECGTRTVKSKHDVLRGFVKSCGCLRREVSIAAGKMPKAFKDLSGKRYGMLVAIAREGSNKHGIAMWRCVCDCGTEKLVSSNHLNMGNTASCGCAYRARKAVRPEARRAWSNNYVQTRYRTDLKYSLNRRLATMIHQSLRMRNSRKNDRWEALVGYSLDALYERLKATMPAGYTWDDFMAGRLHVDHKTPLSAFNFQTETDLDFRRAWALANLQLLPGPDNLSKADKLDGPFQPSLCF